MVLTMWLDNSSQQPLPAWEMIRDYGSCSQERMENTVTPILWVTPVLCHFRKDHRPPIFL